MASANAVSIVRELGIRESGQPGSLAFLGPRDHAAPYHSSCAKTGHHKANRLAYFSRNWNDMRSEEHTSELQSLRHLVCRLLLEKKKTLVRPQLTANMP